MFTTRHQHKLLFFLSVIMTTMMACSLGSPKPIDGAIATPTFPPIADNLTVSPAVPPIGATPTLPPSVTQTPTPACAVSEKFGSRVLQWCPQIMATVKNYPELQPNILAAIIFYGSKGDNLAPSQPNQAVGLMQIMPSDRIDPYLVPYFAQCGPGEKGNYKPYNFNCRPTTQELLDAAFNLDYGSAILITDLNASGNDLRRALAIYGGSKDYADRVLEVLKKYAP